MSHSQPKSRTIRIRLCNSLNTSRELWIEPFGDVVMIEALQTVEIVFAEQADEVSEIQINDSSFAVHGWVQQVLAVDDDGSKTLVWGD